MPEEQSADAVVAEPIVDPTAVAEPIVDPTAVAEPIVDPTAVAAEPVAKVKSAKPAKGQAATNVDALQAEHTTEQVTAQAKAAEGRTERMVSMGASYDALLLYRAHTKWGNPAKMNEAEMRIKLTEMVEATVGELGHGDPAVVHALSALAAK